MINFYIVNPNRNKGSDENGICRWGCNREAKFKHWCSRFPSQCPAINVKRGKAISKTKKAQAKLGLNPMQNPEICKKNHSPERNRKAAETLRKLGQLGLLPQQTESPELKEKRRKNVSKALRKLAKQGLFPTQIESKEKKLERTRKIAKTLKKMAIEGKLAILHLSPEAKKKRSRSLSKTMRRKVKLGQFKPPHAKRVPHITKDGIRIIFRSGWEKDVAKLLDMNNIRWEFESLKIEFWSNIKKRKVITIPDFFLPDFRTIIEVKGDRWLQDEFTQEKINAMKDSELKTILITRKEIEQIRRGDIPEYLLN